MKLGNSKGNNTGKKYFMRGRDDQHEPKHEHRKAADRFNVWFSNNFQQIINFLISKGSYDEDVFSQTYMRISEKVLYTGAEIKDYKAYFSRSYYTNYIQDKANENFNMVPLPVYDTFEAHHSNPYERERMQTQLEIDVFDYVYSRYRLDEFELFKMYISLKPAINYHTLAEITHLQVHNIQRIVSKILTDIRGNKVLVNKYKEIV
ncbi:hypothetical protein JGH11_16820 [Dysgonomonas sp. Marseille-P4677]|uniref:hypothetical protein n=1 Tax=Dysgonomonas sp. Marseille-P4677 TaxID=2364790 RepID=UPI001911CB6C|nr:hypothetical protein [Dysgonomonas sp. Marseille-P4677]MBK5722539.1 hypothetical protein [Dysgonomonas sp. Marseille-P4677]